MPELLTPGVFIQEVDFGPQPIEGVSTTTAGFVGEAEWGPVEGPPTLVTSFPDFQRKFGGFLSGKPLAYAVRGFFDNGGRRAFVVRVAGSTADEADLTIKDGHDVALLSSVGPQLINAIITVRVGSVVGVSAGDLVTFVDTVGATVVTADVQTNGVNAAAGTLTVELNAALPNGLSPNQHGVRYTAPTAGPDRISFEAAYPGTYGRRIAVRLTPIYLAGTVLVSISGTDLVLAAVDGFVAGRVVEVENADGEKQYRTINAVNIATKTITISSALTLAPAPVAGAPVRATGWRLEVFFDNALVETIDQISSDNAATDGVVDRINGISAWVRVTGSPTIAIGPNTTSPSTYPLHVAGVPTFFSQTSGADGTASDADFVGTDVIPRKGLKSLEAQDGVSVIAAPSRTAFVVVNELIGQAERRMDRFAVFESDDDPDAVDVLTARAQYNSRYGAMYHPWVQVLDPLTNTNIALAPSGHVIGAYARTDIERGVFKAPANVVLRGIAGFTRNVPDGEQDLLNPAGVNVLRRFDGLGNVIWGARTISAEGLWKYVPVRRLFIFLEQSIVRGTRFAVFEPNDLRLWARLRDAVTNFLTTQWRAGALFGARPEEAFFVKVDETTTTQDDRDNGRVNIIVGIAPVKPAEFIVFQIGQAPQSVIIAEQT
jgi:phage tail sheath protein FI